MSAFEQDELQPRYDRPAGVWSLAAFSAAVFLLSVLGAKVLSRMVGTEALAPRGPAASEAVAARGVAKATQRPSFMLRGVDMLATGTIPPRHSVVVSPCGEDKGAGRASK